MKMQLWCRDRVIGSAWIGLVSLLLLAACAPAAAPPAAAPTEEAAAATTTTSTDSGFCITDDNAGLMAIQQECGSTADLPTASERDAACADIVAFDGEAAYTGTTDLPIGWTFGINFDAFSTAGNPLGCLHIYQRDDSAGSAGAYVPVDGGGIVVDTCVVTVEPAAVDSPSFNGSTASFCRAGAVQCRMAIGAWVMDPLLQKYVLNSAPSAAPPTLEAELAAFAPAIDVTHVYTDLSLVAAVAWPGEPCALDNQPLPIVQYAPPVGSGDLITLSLEAVSGDTVTVPGATCSSETEWKALPDGLLLWRDHREAALSSGDYPLYQYLTPSGGGGQCTVPGPLDPVSFWLGESMLSIGYDPAAPEISFTGDIDGVLLDPFDSKPPTSGGDDE